MNSDFTQDYFALFALPPCFALDITALERNWRAIASEVHPDRFARAPDAERRRALMIATRVNEAYQTLKKPISRARYLLSLAGVDTQEETNTSMPADFLIAQMEWHEALEDGKADSDIEALERLSREIQADTAALEQALTVQIDHEHNLEAAAVLVRKLRFLEKLEQDTGDAIEALLY
jgi:molecular chaperone HscB